MKLTDILAAVLATGPLDLATVRSAASELDERPARLALYALEELLEHDDRFESDGSLWRLAQDAPVPKAAVGEVSDPDYQDDIPTRITDFVIVDVEATGTEPSRAALLEIASLRIRDLEIVDEFETYVYTTEVPAAITALTGISEGDIRSAPEAEQAVGSWLKFAAGLPIAGQNVRFDLEMITNHAADYRPTAILECLDLAHIAFPRATSRSLEALADLLDVEFDVQHRALADCQTTFSILKQLLGMINRDEALWPIIRGALARSGHPWSLILDPANGEPQSSEILSTSAAGWLKRPSSEAPAASTANETFGEKGLLVAAIPEADFRPAQHQMANEIEEAVREHLRLMIEAPTGTGKTFAYLVPAIRHASTERKPAWISTNTKALQTQLQGDFQKLREMKLVGGEMAVLKGKRNYLCTRDLLAAMEVELDPGAAVEAAALLNLLWDAEEGELAELSDYWLTRSYPAAREIRATVSLNPATCEGSNCEFYETCPYFAALERARTAPVVAVNHSLLVTAFGELGEQDADVSEISTLIVDEAHMLEDAATSTLTDELDPSAVNAWLNQLIDETSSSGLLRNVGRAFGMTARDNEQFAAALEIVRRTRKANRIFAERMALYISEFVGRPEFGDYPITHRFRFGMDDHRFLFLEARQALLVVAELSKELIEALRQLLGLSNGLTAAGGFHGKALRRRLLAEATRADELVELCLTLLSFSQGGSVSYVTWEAAESPIPALVLTRAPLDVSETLRRIYDHSPSVIATSASLTVGGIFDYMRDRLAMSDFVSSTVPETFDYSSQASFLLTRHLPIPRSVDDAEFVEAVADTLIASIGTSRGGTLALFTSRKRLAKTFELAEAGIRYEGLEVRGQLPGSSTRELGDWFRGSEEGSLFGLRSFWEGFDAPGDTLRLVMIEKLPFPSPADPLFSARSDGMEAEGRDPFYEYAVPKTALALKQGFGRLIRTKTDRGVVVLLDRRLRTGLSYQADLLESLPVDLALGFPTDETDYLVQLAGALTVDVRLDLAAGVGPKRPVIDLAKTTVTDPMDPSQVSNALKAILGLFRLESFRPGQEDLIRSVLVDHRDVVGVMPTGAGKSLVFQALSMAIEGVGIVVSPLVALMKDQIDGLRNDLGFRWAHALIGGMSGAERDEILDAVRSGGSRLLYVSPERLRDPTLLRALRQVHISFVAVDEAHCVSVWGHDFRPDFLSITSALEGIPGGLDAPRLALTATAPSDVFDDIVAQLKLRDPLVERSTVDRPNLHFSVVKCKNRKEKRTQLARIALAYPGGPGIVYCSTRNDAEAAAALLRSQGTNARHYHAGMPAEQREAVQDMFMTDQVAVICATNAFGLGVDKPDIAFVVHWALPFSIDAYFQEAGRAARDPRLFGAAILLWTPSDRTVLERLVSSTLPTIDDLENLESKIAGAQIPFLTVEQLADETSLDETTVRVGVHLLQRAGAVHQGVDVAARGFMSIPASQSRLADRFDDDVAAGVRLVAESADLEMPGRGVIDTIGTASRLGLEVPYLESMLYGYAEREILGYRTVVRAMNLTSTGSDWDRIELSDHLTRLRRSSFDRLESIVNYARSKSCRRQSLLYRFGESAPDTCNSCDVCVGVTSEVADVDPVRYTETSIVNEHVATSIVGIVKEASRLGSSPGRKSFVRGLKGTRGWGDFSIPEVLARSRHFGSLRYLTEGEIEEAIESMVNRGAVFELEHHLSNGDTYVGLDVRL